MRMQIGVVFPQTEIGADVGPIKAYVQAAEELGYDHLLAYDHVVGADPEVHAPWQGPYDIDTTFHEPFVLFGYLAARTTMELVTGIIQQSDNRYTLVQLRERVEALLPRSEQVYNERYDHGMRVKAVITEAP